MYGRTSGGGRRCVFSMAVTHREANVQDCTTHQFVTVPLTIAGFTGGVMTFGNMSMDPTKPIFVCACVCSAQRGMLTYDRHPPL